MEKNDGLAVDSADWATEWWDNCSRSCRRKLSPAGQSSELGAANKMSTVGRCVGAVFGLHNSWAFSFGPFKETTAYFASFRTMMGQGRSQSKPAWQTKSSTFTQRRVGCRSYGTGESLDGGEGPIRFDKDSGLKMRAQLLSGESRS